MTPRGDKEKRDEEEAKRFEELFDRSVERWLNKKYAQFGRWTFGLIGVSVFIALLQVLMRVHGYHKTKVREPTSISSMFED